MKQLYVSRVHGCEFYATGFVENWSGVIGPSCIFWGKSEFSLQPFSTWLYLLLEILFIFIRVLIEIAVITNINV